MSLIRVWFLSSPISVLNPPCNIRRVTPVFCLALTNTADDRNSVQTSQERGGICCLAEGNYEKARVQLGVGSGWMQNPLHCSSPQARSLLPGRLPPHSVGNGPQQLSDSHLQVQCQREQTIFLQFQLKRHQAEASVGLLGTSIRTHAHLHGQRTRGLVDRVMWSRECLGKWAPAECSGSLGGEPQGEESEGEERKAGSRPGKLCQAVHSLSGAQPGSRSHRMSSHTLGVNSVPENLPSFRGRERILCLRGLHLLSPVGQKWPCEASPPRHCPSIASLCLTLHLEAAPAKT